MRLDRAQPLLPVVRRAPHFSILLTRITPKENRAIRQQLDYDKRASLRASWRSLADEELHHIIPLCLGGSNDADNLTLVERELHLGIHDWFDEQMRGMEIGGQRTIKVPYIAQKHWRVVRRPVLPRL